MRVLIVIVNYRTPQLTLDCLQSLEPELQAFPPGDVRVVVTDNLSPDDSVQRIGAAIAAHGWSGWCTLLPLPKNGGFAYGNNEGIRHVLGDLPLIPAVSVASEADARATSRPDYVYLLNPDTLVLEGAVRELVGFMDAHPACGIAGGRAQNRDGSVRRSVFRFHSLLGEVEGTLRFGPVSRLLRRHVVAPPVPEGASRADWVSGASMMIRRQVLEQVGLLDDGYFMYFEETDFCLRAHRAGWQTWHVPASRIIHLVGQSSGVTGTQRAARRRPKYWFDSRHRYFRKNLGVATALAADLLWTGLYPVSRLLQLARREKRVDPPWLWWDFVRYNFGSWMR
jgi:GT2 family glycosyltransferase